MFSIHPMSTDGVDVAPSMPPLAEDVPLVLPSTVMQIHYSPCQGFQNIDFIHYATLNLLSCLSKYDYRNGQWTSRNCLGIALDNPSSKSKIGPRCENCTSCARKLSRHKNSQIEKSSTLQLRDNIHSWWSNNGSFDDGTVIGRRCHALAEMDTVKLSLSSKSFIPCPGVHFVGEISVKSLSNYASDDVFIHADGSHRSKSCQYFSLKKLTTSTF